MAKEKKAKRLTQLTPNARAKAAKSRAKQKANAKARKQRQDAKVREGISLAVEMRIQGKGWDDIAPVLGRKDAASARQIVVEHPKLWHAEERRQVAEYTGQLQQESLFVLRAGLRSEASGEKRKSAEALLKNARECDRIQLAAQAKKLDVKLRLEKGMVGQLADRAVQRLVAILREEIRDERTIDRIAARLGDVVSDLNEKQPGPDFAPPLFRLG